MIDPLEPLSVQDIDRGFKEVVVEHLDGKSVLMRMSAPNWRERMNACAQIGEQGDPAPIILACLPTIHRNEEFLNQLTVASISELQCVALAWMNGNPKKKAPAEAAPPPVTVKSTKAS